MFKQWLTRKSIKSEFLVLTIPVLVGGFLLNAWISIAVVQEALQENAFQEMRHRVQDIAHLTKNWDETLRSDLLLAIENPYFQDYFSPPARASKEAIVAHQREKREGLYAMVSALQGRFPLMETCLIDTEGHEHLRFIRGVLQAEEQFSTTEKGMPYFDQAFAQNKGEVFRSRPYISPDIEEWVISYASPIVMPDGSKPAFLHFELPLSYVQTHVWQTYPQLSNPEKATNERIFILNGQGFLLFDSHQQLSFAVQDTLLPHIDTIYGDTVFLPVFAAMQEKDEDRLKIHDAHQRYWVVFKNIPSLGLSIVTVRPEKQLLTDKISLGKISMVLVGVALFVVLLTTLLIVMGSERVTRPLRLLTNVVNARSKDRFECTFFDAPPSNEVGILVRSLRAMCEDLSAHQASLQKKIMLRTEHLEITHSVLDDTIQQLTEFAEIADAASRSKSLFVANMSHEIRTPMNAILGMTHLCLQSDMPPKQREYIEKINNSANYLLNIINDILDFSKLEAGKMVLEIIPFHLDDVLHDLMPLFIPSQEKGVEIIISADALVPHTLLGDPSRLSQALTQLINNAVKFTASGEIFLEIKPVDSSEPMMLQFSIRDTGIGIKEEQKQQLFQTFVQVDGSTSRHYGGIGLGLTVCKGLVALMGGSIEVESRFGQGSTFSFVIPYSLPDVAKRRCFQLPDALQGKRVLLVDDNLACLKGVGSVLEALSFQVVALSSGVEGLIELNRMAQMQRPFDLLVLDWQMPRLDGMQTLHCLKAQEYPMNVPVIMMVPRIEQAHVKRYLGDQQPDAYLDKPVYLSTLFDTIMNLFGHGNLLVSDKRVILEPIQNEPLAVDPALLLHTLELLIPHLEKKRPKNCFPILEALERMAFPAGMMQNRDNLVVNIRKYRLKEALPILDDMLTQLR